MQRSFDWVLAVVPVLGALGCSDPVPAAGAIGLTLNVGQSGSCPMTVMPGVIDDLGHPPPDSSNSNMGKRVYSGEGGLEASCSVSGTGPFSLRATVSSPQPRLTFDILNGSVDTNGMGTASIALSTTAIGTSVESPTDTPCTLNVDQTSGGLQVKPGAIWARFTCQKLVNTPSPICFASGEFILENCSK